MKLTLNFYDAQDQDNKPFRAMAATLRYELPDGSKQTVNVMGNADDPNMKEVRQVHDALILDMLALKKNETRREMLKSIRKRATPRKKP